MSHLNDRLKNVGALLTQHVDAMEAALAADDQVAFDRAKADHDTTSKEYERVEAAIAARKAMPQVVLASANSVGVTSEPTTYGKGSPYSIFGDMRAAFLNPGAHDAHARLQRHHAEMQGAREGDVQFDLSSTDAAGGQLVAPLYLQEEFINLARANRVIVDAIGVRDLPPQTDSINIPRMATGTAVADQADNAPVQETDATFDSINAAVKTIAGMQDASQQLVDRSVPGADQVIFGDLAGAYGVNLDTAVINSAVANNLGLLQVAGINTITYTDTSPTVPELWPRLADAQQQIALGVLKPADAIFMHPRRWAWMLTERDTTGRPLFSPVAQQNAPGQFGVVAEGAVGTLMGLPVYLDANIPTNLGAGTNEDRIIVCRRDELFVWEDPAGPYLGVFPDVGSGTLTVRFRLHSYWAQANGRRPKAITVIAGTGLTPPTFV